jgi:hypothetical protein
MTSAHYSIVLGLLLAAGFGQTAPADHRQVTGHVDVGPVQVVGKAK